MPRTLGGRAHRARGRPDAAPRELDWVAKYRLLEGYRERDGLEWSDAKLRLIDLQYHDVRRDKGLYHRLVATGQVERLVSDEDVERAIMEPPEDTRAYFRGRCISRYPDAIAAASWDSIIFDTGAEALQRVPMREPLRGTKEHVDELFERGRRRGRARRDAPLLADGIAPRAPAARVLNRPGSLDRCSSGEPSTAPPTAPPGAVRLDGPGGRGRVRGDRDQVPPPAVPVVRPVAAPSSSSR